jgi:hypothetical protein
VDLRALQGGTLKFSATVVYNLSRLNGSVAMEDLEAVLVGVSVEEMREVLHQAWLAGLVSMT